MTGGSSYTTKIIDPKINGLVVGAHNNKKLVIKIFEPGDLQASQEYFGSKKTKWYKRDYSTELKLVRFKGKDFSLHAEIELIRLVNIYISNEKLDPIKYPENGIGFNSNSWVQSVIEIAGGIVVGGGNMKGFDLSYNKRIPKTYFSAYCPIEKRIRLN